MTTTRPAWGGIPGGTASCDEGVFPVVPTGVCLKVDHAAEWRRRRRKEVRLLPRGLLCTDDKVRQREHHHDRHRRHSTQETGSHPIHVQPHSTRRSARRAASNRRTCAEGVKNQAPTALVARDLTAGRGLSQELVTDRSPRRFEQALNSPRFHRSINEKQRLSFCVPRSSDQCGDVG